MNVFLKKAVLFTVALLLSACNKPQHENLTEDLTHIATRLDGVAFGAVDSINGVAAPKAGDTISVSGDKIEIAGNYVDAVRGEAAAGVVVLIGDKTFTTVYGGERPDIAKAHNNPKYLKSQFYVNVPASAVAKGAHEVAVRVIASDRSGYYDSGAVAKIELK